MPSASRAKHPREQDRRPAIEPIALRVPEACRFVGIGRDTLYVMIARGEVAIVRVGSSTVGANGQSEAPDRWETRAKRRAGRGGHFETTRSVWIAPISDIET